MSMTSQEQLVAFMKEAEGMDAQALEKVFFSCFPQFKYGMREGSVGIWFCNEDVRMIDPASTDEECQDSLEALEEYISESVGMEFLRDIVEVE